MAIKSSDGNILNFTFNVTWLMRTKVFRVHKNIRAQLKLNRIIDYWTKDIVRCKIHKRKKWKSNVSQNASLLILRTSKVLETRLLQFSSIAQYDNILNSIKATHFYQSKYCYTALKIHITMNYKISSVIWSCPFAASELKYVRPVVSIRGWFPHHPSPVW